MRQKDRTKKTAEEYEYLRRFMQHMLYERAQTFLTPDDKAKIASATKAVDVWEIDTKHFRTAVIEYMEFLVDKGVKVEDDWWKAPHSTGVIGVADEIDKGETV